MALHHVADVFLRKLGALGDLVDDLAVIIFIAQRLGKAAAKLASAASEFAADGDDGVTHGNLLLAFWNGEKAFLSLF